jgi:RNA polymerase sigma factor (sigma-70 family)
MKAADSQGLLQHIRRLADGPQSPPSDGELLRRYLEAGDQAAFAALLRRHGTMVFAVCHSVLRQRDDAEDAFQAAFLILARKAGSIRRQEGLGGWLQRVAYRVALKARARNVRRHEREAQAASPRSTVSGGEELSWGEVRAILHAELAALPEHFRAPLVLCYLEGLTQEEAAQQLDWTATTVKGRLQRGRERLRRRLERRGIALSAALGAALTGQALAESGVPTFQSFTAETATPAAASLARGFLRPLAPMKLALLSAVLLSIGVAAGGMALRSPPPRSEEQPAAVDAKPAQQPAEPRAAVDAHGDPLPEGAVARLGTMRFRHIGDVISVAYSPDGKVIASGQRNEGPIILWDAATGKELRRLEEQPGVRGGFAFSPDGKQLALVKWGEWVGLWDVATGKQTRRLKIQPGGCVTFSADGKRMAVPSSTQVVLLDAVSGKELRRLQGHPETIQSLAFSPDGKLLAAGGDGKSVCLWDVGTGKQLHVLKGHQQQVPSVAFSADGQILASASHDRTVRLWDVATGQERRRFTHQERDDDAIQTIHFVPKHPWLVTGGLRTIRVWDLSTGKEVRRFRGHFCLCDCPVTLSPDGTKLASRNGDEQGQILLWDLQTGKRLCPPQGHQRPIGSVAFSPDGKTLATGSWDETLRLWDAASGKEVRRFAQSFDVQASFMPDGKTLAASSSDGLLHFCGAATGKELRQFSTHKGGLGRVTFAADGKTCVTSGVNTMEFAADGKTSVEKTSDTVIRRWRVDTGAEIGRFEGLAKAASGLALAPDGKTMVSVTDKSAILWNVASGKEIRPFHGHEGWLGCVAYSPDGKTVAGAGDDKIVHLWDITTGEERQRFVGHQGSISAVRFSPDGRMLASGGHDRTVRLWEIASGQERQRFEGHRHCVFALDFSRDGLRLASAGYDATVLVWDVTGRLTSERAGAVRLSEKELTRLWAELGDEKDAARPYQAMRVLLRDPTGTMRWFREHLRPIPATAGTQIAQWIADLDSAEFAVREKAMRELTQRGEAVEGALREALENRPSLEVRQRIKVLLERLQGAHRLRMLRAVEVLEHLGTLPARQVLESLARGAPDSRLTQEAKASLARLTRRPANQP